MEMTQKEALASLTPAQMAIIDYIPVLIDRLGGTQDQCNTIRTVVLGVFTNPCFAEDLQGLLEELQSRRAENN